MVSTQHGQHIVVLSHPTTFPGISKAASANQTVGSRDRSAMWRLGVGLKTRLSPVNGLTVLGPGKPSGLVSDDFTPAFIREFEEDLSDVE